MGSAGQGLKCDSHFMYMRDIHPVKCSYYRLCSETSLGGLWMAKDASFF